MSNLKTLLITGASSGIGLQSASLLAARGHTVIGTGRRPAPQDPGRGFEMLQMDVRESPSIEAAVEQVLSRHGRIDALINNAGYALFGALEETDLQQARDQFETNLFGLHAVTRAVLPGMRRQGTGRILNIGSLAGLVPVPFWGLYSASKFAVEGYTEALWHELGPLGIHVSLIEPGFVRTGLARHGAQVGHRIEAYARWRANAQASIAAHADKATSPEKVARTVTHVLEARTPRLRYTVGSDAALVSRLRRILPESVLRRIWRREFGLDRPGQQRTPDTTLA